MEEWLLAGSGAFRGQGSQELLDQVPGMGERVFRRVTDPGTEGTVQVGGRRRTLVLGTDLNLPRSPRPGAPKEEIKPPAPAETIETSLKPYGIISLRHPFMAVLMGDHHLVAQTSEEEQSPVAKAEPRKRTDPPKELTLAEKLIMQVKNLHDAVEVVPKNGSLIPWPVNKRTKKDLLERIRSATPVELREIEELMPDLTAGSNWLRDRGY
jgi:hypothetical protein